MWPKSKRSTTRCKAFSKNIPKKLQYVYAISFPKILQEKWSLTELTCKEISSWIWKNGLIKKKKKKENLEKNEKIYEKRKEINDFEQKLVSADLDKKENWKLEVITENE